MTVFLDTVGLLALCDESDQWHGIAKKSFDQLSITRANVVTTTFVMLECGNAAARRPYRSAVGRLRQPLEQGQRLVEPTTEDWQRAWHSYDQGGNKFRGNSGSSVLCSYAAIGHCKGVYQRPAFPGCGS